MVPCTLKDRVDSLVDDLFQEGGVSSASLASILVAVQEAIERDYLLDLSRQVWSANNELKLRLAEPAAPKPARRRGKRQAV